MASAISASGSQGAILRRAGVDSLFQLDPRKRVGNPVILATEVVAALATVSVVDAFVHHTSPGFAVQIALWLWATVLFANFAESVAEGRGKAAADSLRAARVTTNAKLLDPVTGQITLTSSTQLAAKGDLVLVEAGDVMPADGDIVEGVASVNESAITGESAASLIPRELGGDPLAR